MAVTATIVVDFGGGSTGDEVLQAEVDNRPLSEGGLNISTSFSAGDTVFMLVYKSAGVSGLTGKVSAGNLVSQGSVLTRTVTEVLTFEESNSANVGYPIASITSVEWFGTNLGSVVKSGSKSVKSSQSGVAVAKVTYTTEYSVYRLNSPTSINGKVDYTILVYFSGTV